MDYKQRRKERVEFRNICFPTVLKNSDSPPRVSLSSKLISYAGFVHVYIRLQLIKKEYEKCSCLNHNIFIYIGYFVLLFIRHRQYKIMYKK